MDIVPIEAAIAVLVGFAIVILVFGLGRSRSASDTRPRAHKQPVVSKTSLMFSKPRSASKLVFSNLHPFAWDRRVVFAAIFGLVSLALRLWLLIPIAMFDGYLFGEMFLPAGVVVMAQTLRDSMLFVSQLASSLGVGNASLGEVVIASIEALPRTSPFRLEREAIYRTLVSMQIDTDNDDDDSNANQLLAQLFANDTLGELRAIDELIYSSLTNTQWKLRDQLNDLSETLSRRLRALNEVIANELLPGTQVQKFIALFSVAMNFFTILLFGASGTIAHELAENVIVSLTIGVTLFLSAFLTLRARLPLFYPTLFL
jgi:hypothetical protein